MPLGQKQGLLRELYVMRTPLAAAGPRVLVETCVDSLDTAIAALEGGSDRLEICSRLDVGGFSPSEDVLDAILATRDAIRPSCRCFVMVRPWLDGKRDFDYTGRERDKLLEEVERLASKRVDGLVVGCLRRGGVDGELMEAIGRVAESRSIADVTFHRAFDEIPGCRRESIDTLAKYRLVTRVLTSGGLGQSATVVRHLESLRVLRLYAAKYGVVIMPGSGVTAGNVVEVVRATGCREVHGSFDGGNSVRDVRSNLQG